MEEKTFGQIIRDCRQKLGMSQKELAEKIIKEDGKPISSQYQNDIEHDRRNPPGESLIRQYAGHLKLEIDYLLMAARILPDDIRKEALKNPDKADQLFKAFRKKS